MPPTHILSWLMVLDLIGIIDSPIPTTDDEILNALKSVAENGKLSRKQRIESLLRTSTGINWFETIFGVSIPSATGV